MEVLSIVCYIISSPSAFILIIFRVAHWKLLYIYIFFPKRFISLFHSHCANNMVYKARPVLRIILFRSCPNQYQEMSLTLSPNAIQNHFDL